MKCRHHTFLIINLLGILSFFTGPLKAEEVDLAEIPVLKEYNFLFRSRNYAEVKSQIARQKEPSYLESYLMASVLQRERRISESALWFARAGFKYKPLPCSGSFQDIKSYMDSGIRRSGLYADSVYELARVFLTQGKSSYASAMLDMVPKTTDAVLNQKVTELRVEIIGHLNPAMAVEIYRSILKDNPSPLVYLKMGGLEYISGNTEKALDHYFAAMAYPENDWTYLKAANQIQFIQGKFPALSSKFTESRKAQVAEALRIDKKYHHSLALWKQIDPSRLEKSELVLYVQNYCRLATSLRQYRLCETILSRHAASLDQAGRDQVYTDVSARLFEHGQYYLITSIIPFGESRAASLMRVRALEKIRNPDRRREAGEYLRKFDSDSTFAEGVFFSACFEHIEAKNTAGATECLTELRDLTIGVSTGGRSRYFLGRLHENAGDVARAEEFFKDVYLNSPEHFYAFGALTRVKNYDKSDSINPPEQKSPEDIHNIRKWIADNYNNETALKKYLALKKTHDGYGVDQFWKDFEKKFANTIDSLEAGEKKAAAFLSMGLDTSAEEYFGRDQANLEKKFMVYLKAGLLIEDAYLKAGYMQSLLNIYKRQSDIMTASQLVIDSLYPTPFRSIVSSASEKYKIEEAQVYALMKQESGFHPGATSRSGARGLMQIMPATASWLNKSMKIKSLDLYNPRHSIEMGAVFYSWLNKISEGDFEKMAIAYNAGPGRLRQWINRYYQNDFEVFLEKIPADETYYYVQKTRKNYDRYRILLKN